MSDNFEETIDDAAIVAWAIDRDELLKVAEELEADYWDCAGKHRLDTISVDKALTFEREMAARIRKAVGE